MSDLKSIMRRAVNKLRDDGIEQGRLGVHRPDTTVDMQVTGRPGWLHVTLNGQTPVKAFNKAGVPQTTDLQVEMRVIDGRRVIIGVSGHDNLSVPVPTPASGVALHASTHQHGGDDEVATATPGANAIVKADADGKIGAGWIDDADINLDNVTEGTTNKFYTATEQTKLAGIEALADVTDAGNVGSSIHGATAKTTPADADTMPLIDSAASNVLKKVTWANIKATLKTYFDTLYNLYVHPNHSGDVTSVADGAQTIANSAVTLAKMANLAESTVIGRASGAGTGVPTALSVSQLNAIIDSAAIFLLLAGRSGGQTAYGGTAAGNGLTLLSTSHATKGTINLGNTVYVDGVNSREGVGISSPTNTMHIVSTESAKAALLVDASATAYDAASGLARFIDDNDREVVIGGLGMFRRDADVDNGDLRFNFLGYNGGVTRYRDYKIYDGKSNLLFLVDGSEGKTSVGSLTTIGASKLGIQAGSSSNDAAAGGVLVKDFGSYGNVGTGEDNLVSFSVLADTLSADNMSLTIKALGAAFNSASTKVVRMKWGGTTISTLTIAAGADYTWRFEGELYRLGASNGLVIGQWMTNTGSAAAAIYPFTQTFGSLAFSSARTILFTGQITSGSDNDVTSDYFRVDWSDQNT